MEMAKTGYYYLHTNGNLIYKSSFVVESDPEYFSSPFVKKYWKIKFSDRKDAWTLIIEALALGANINKIKELADKWHLDFNDSVEFVSRIKPNPLLTKGMALFIKNVLNMDVDEYWENKAKIRFEEIKSEN